MIVRRLLDSLTLVIIACSRDSWMVFTCSEQVQVNTPFKICVTALLGDYDSGPTANVRLQDEGRLMARPNEEQRRSVTLGQL